ncbi:MAG: hypothetical protein OQL28_06510 [Sedimenticola sp.]|nr:hypothetical protein [Sedimenticola sp.]
MKRMLALGVLAAGLLAGCGADESSDESGTVSSVNESTSQARTMSEGTGDSKAQSSLDKAAEQARTSAQNAGEVISESTESLRKEWSEMNEERHESAPVEDTSMPVEQPEADMDALKQGYEEVKKSTMEKTGELIDKAKKMAE